MMEDEDGLDSNTFHYNQLVFHQHQQQDMLIQPPFTSQSSTFNPTYNNHFHVPPAPSYSYGCTYSDDQLYMSSSNLTDDQETLFASSSLSGPAGRSSSLLTNMLSHEFEKIKSMNMMYDKALAASRSHSEAERRRRERINSHLTRLRSLLPNTTKTDKASLLAEVIQHVKDLKQQASALPECNTFPTDFDELTFETCTAQDGQLLIKVSLCCDDRSDILQDLIKTCRTLNLRTVKADITTLAGRMKYVAFIARDPEANQTCDESVDVQVSSLAFSKTVQEAFGSVIGRSLRKLDEKGPQSDPCMKRKRVKECSSRAT